MWLPLQHVFQDKCLRRILDADLSRDLKQIWLTFLTAGLYDVLITNSFIGCHQAASAVKIVKFGSPSVQITPPGAGAGLPKH